MATIAKPHSMMVVRLWVDAFGEPIGRNKRATNNTSPIIKQLGNSSPARNRMRLRIVDTKAFKSSLNIHNGLRRDKRRKVHG